MKFKKGKLYKVVKGNTPCIGCILRYEGFNYGEPVILSKSCKKYSSDLKRHNSNFKGCWVFELTKMFSNDYKLIKSDDMVEFCKKLRKERNNDT